MVMNKSSIINHTNKELILNCKISMKAMLGEKQESIIKDKDTKTIMSLPPEASNKKKYKT